MLPLRALTRSAPLLSALALVACRGADQPTSATPPADTPKDAPTPAATAQAQASSTALAPAQPQLTAAPANTILPPTPSPLAATVQPIGPSPAALPGTMPCTRDDECVVTTYAGCCACCPATPYPTRVDELAKGRQVCTRVRCASCAAIDCKPPEDETAYRAVCKDRKCAAVKR